MSRPTRLKEVVVVVVVVASTIDLWMSFIVVADIIVLPEADRQPRTCCLSVCLSICLCIFLPACRFVCLSVWVSNDHFASYVTTTKHNSRMYPWFISLSSRQTPPDVCINPWWICWSVVGYDCTSVTEWCRFLCWGKGWVVLFRISENSNEARGTLVKTAKHGSGSCPTIEKGIMNAVLD